MKSLNLGVLFLIALMLGCKSSNTPQKEFRYLALGDSYTIGESVCDSCKFPLQLAQKIKDKKPNLDIRTKVIAKTGWTTTQLKEAISMAQLEANFDKVTLLIGVNNQYQKKDFALYEKEFPELLKESIRLAKGNYKNVIVVSIPDYAFTPFGQKRPNANNISKEIAQYNLFAENYCKKQSVSFVNITPITQQGLNDATLVAQDELHPSEKAYSEFVNKIVPIFRSSL